MAIKLKRARRGERGYTLIELLIVISLIIALGALAARQILREQDESIAKISADQMATITTAANSYIAGHFQEIVNPLVSPVDPKLVCSGAPSAPNQPISRYCVLTDLSPLIADGLIEQGMLTQLPFNKVGTWKVFYGVAGASPTYQVSGFVVSSLPWAKGTGANEAMAALVANQAGPDAFAVRSGVGQGVGGQFQVASTDIPAAAGAPMASGQVGMRLGSSSGSQDFLKLDGTNSMLGTLAMGGTGVTNSMVNINGVIEGSSSMTLKGALLVGSNPKTERDNYRAGAASASHSTLFKIDVGAAGSRPVIQARSNAAPPAAWGYATANDPAVSTSQLWAGRRLGVGVPDAQGDSSNPAAWMDRGGMFLAKEAVTGRIGAEGSASATSNKTIVGQGAKDAFGNETAWGSSPTVSLGQVSVNDIYLRELGHWASEVSPMYAGRNIVPILNRGAVAKPTCANNSSGIAGQAKIVVTPYKMPLTTQLVYGGTYYGVNIPSQWTYGETLTRAVDYGTYWQVFIWSPTQFAYDGGPSGGAQTDPMTNEGHGIAQVYCYYPPQGF